MSLARHCDGLNCDTWQRLDSEIRQDWIDVSEEGEQTHFCSADCLLLFYARRAPEEVIEFP